MWNSGIIAELLDERDRRAQPQSFDRRWTLKKFTNFTLPGRLSKALRSTVGSLGISSLASTGCAAAQELDAARERMVAEQLERRDIRDKNVLDAMRRVPRHLFTPRALWSSAYADHALPIGHGQTISQPYIVALMSQLAEVGPGDRVLEIGTGSGYQSAVLQAMGVEVFTIEIVEELAQGAKELFQNLGLERIHTRTGNGYLGWPEQAPFDAIVVTAAPPKIPEALLEQLGDNGKLVIPVGPMDSNQLLMRLTRRPDGSIEQEEVTPVRFVPMVRER